MTNFNGASRLSKVLVFISIISKSAFGFEVSDNAHKSYIGDFDALQKKGVVRVLVSGDVGFYHIENGKPKGILAEQIHYFQQALKVRDPLLRVQVIPVERSELLSALNQGRGDIAVANLTVTKEREQLVDFSIPIRSDIDELLVTNHSTPLITDITQLQGKEVWLKQNSSYISSVHTVNKQLEQNGMVPIYIHLLSNNIQDLELLDLIKRGKITATIVDSHKLELWGNLEQDIRIHRDLAFRHNADIAWAIRKNNPQLKAQIDQYLQDSKQGTLLGNVIDNRYLESISWMNRASNALQNEEREKLEELFVAYGEKYEINWLILLAMAFQESGLDNTKISHRGAVGIMQVMPKTARDWYVDIDDVYDLESNIHAGSKYLRFIYDRYFDLPELSDIDKIHFSLAAYNAGPAKIRRMRVLAAKQGFNPNKWFNHVEVIARKNISQEPVKYVANINRYFTIYQRLDEFQDIREEQLSNMTRQLNVKRFSPYFAY
ncbi:transglycosylase SLT domain-containing protein [Vibrio lentus]|uniref:transglycosylase SLT domain-containing protein n=1 Tax=Vibrio lentus TaxID=136468 RepID=UPI0009782541|nr:transporter substrate-binding domain-containing protein [Vibrio lentus]MCC4785287.1 transporter substrate-binding domain-containing protein [Vibrio lentus]OMO23060.1 lytic transglycosylase F [Vibrio lentus]PME66374.1 lytic transglycosylase F [Vibrio lentus]PMG59240.1 lytic transglycosylase F [Vibrio lentus]PMI97068.1 lytic transglycosylase F [Vibrio lentus]